MVYGFAKKSGSVPTWREMKHAILRNFGGLDGVEPVEDFSRNFSWVCQHECTGMYPVHNETLRKNLQQLGV